MAVRGNLGEVSLPDVLQLLALGRKTGCLTVTDRSSVGYVYLRDGRITYASIVNRRDRLGDILVRKGLITVDALDMAVERQSKERDRRLGELLVDGGAISRDDLHGIVRLQIEEAVYFLFTWTRGSFRFDADRLPEAQDYLVSINPETLLLEGARRVDEWSVIEKRIPSLDVLFQADATRIANADVRLSPIQERIVPLLNGENSAEAIVEDTAISEFEVGKALFGLLSAGFIRPVGRARRQRSGASLPPIEEHRNLGVAFYRTGMLEESRREFRRLVELREGDAQAHAYLGLIALRQASWEEAIGRFGRARECGADRPALQYHLALALEAAGRLDDSEDAYAAAVDAAPHHWQIMMGWGIVAMRRGDYREAAARLDRARGLAGDEPVGPVWAWARGLAASAVGDHEVAERVLQDGLERQPANAVLRNNLAVVLEARGAVQESEALLLQAISDDPWLPHLSKNLGDVYYRSGRFDDAWDAYQQVVRLQPEFGDDVYFRLGNIANRRMDREAAGALWRQALVLNPEHELARANLETLEALS